MLTRTKGSSKDSASFFGKYVFPDVAGFNGFEVMRLISVTIARLSQNKYTVVITLTFHALDIVFALVFTEEPP